MTFLSPRERRTLKLICETFAPALYPEAGEDPRLFELSAADVDLATYVEIGLEQSTDASERQQIKLVLQTLEIPLINRIGVGIHEPFSNMSADERERTLRAWGLSKLAPARQIFQAFKRLALFLFYGLHPVDGDEFAPNPAWETFGYTPPEMVDTPRDYTPLDIHRDTMLTADVVVIGSGAGGGVVAGELAAAGFDVLVIEKGGYYAERDFHGRELQSMQMLYEKQGTLASKDLQIAVLAGSSLGGGTTINWTASLRTPDVVLNEWAREYGFSAANTPAFAASLDAVQARMGVSDDESIGNGHNCMLENGAKSLGYDMIPVPRNAQGCITDGGSLRCGFCNFGCRYGAKKGVLKTYLRDAVDHGARVIVNAYAQRVLIERGAAAGVLLRVTGSDGIPHAVTVKAKIVVAAGGAIHTPALLLRSGLTNTNIGANLKLHPVAPLYGVFEQPIIGWEGAPLTRLSRQFADADGSGYGTRLETAPLHPGIAALATTWVSARQHRRVMQQIAHLSNVIVITRDKFGGSVKLNAAGDPVIHYKLHPYDAKHLMQGIIGGLRVLHAAGAFELSSPHARNLVYYPCPEKSPFKVKNEYASFEAFLHAVQAEGLKPNAFALFSAHQMSSARIGGNASLGAVNPSGESYDVKNLYVADGSALPTASGVNPMITIMAVAHYIAGHIKAAHTA